MILSIMTLSIVTLSIVTLSKVTLSTKGLYVYTQHKNALLLCSVLVC
jgi:hypothetical protein